MIILNVYLDLNQKSQHKRDMVLAKKHAVSLYWSCILNKHCYNSQLGSSSCFLYKKVSLTDKSVINSRCRLLCLHQSVFICVVPVSMTAQICSLGFHMCSAGSCIQVFICVEYTKKCFMHLQSGYRFFTALLKRCRVVPYYLFVDDLIVN